MTITKDLIGWNSWTKGPLRSGPMLGEVGEDDAHVWVQARDTSPLTLTIYRPDNSTMKFVVNPATTNGLCVVFHVTGLVEGTKYEYDLVSQHGTTPRYKLRTGLPKSSRRVRIAFGSCFRHYQEGNLTIFDALANEQSDLFIMTGDNSYFLSSADWHNEDSMMLAHLRHRNNDALRKLIPNLPVLGIWDDHDFGSNDSDSRFPGKNDALSAFKHVWAQRTYGLPDKGVPGIFSSVRCGPMEIFLLDGRYYRLEKNHILGTAQLNWLKDKLKNSTAPVKLIVSGSVVLPEFVKTIEQGSWEGWKRDASNELDTLLSYIEAHDIKGVLFVSGDLHLGYLMHRPGRDLKNGQQGPDFWEVVSSPLAQDIWPHQVMDSSTPTYDPWLVQEVANENYGLLDIDLDRSGQEICLSLKNEHGVPCFVQPVALDSLRVRQSVKKKLSAVVWNNGKTYFFKGDRYVRYTMEPAHEGVDSDFPKAIAGNWNGLAEAFPNGIDAAVVWPNGKAYFFKGNGYVRYTMDSDSEGVDSGYPKYIRANWNGLWSSGIDAAVVWPNGKAYFFKGDEYVSYTIDPAHEGVDTGYPKPIKGNWKGLAEAFPEGIDAAVVWPNGKAYFFKGDQYVRYTIDPANEGVDTGYPKPIKGNWPGLLESL